MAWGFLIPWLACPLVSIAILLFAKQQRLAVLYGLMGFALPPFFAACVYVFAAGETNIGAMIVPLMLIALSILVLPILLVLMAFGEVRELRGRDS